MWRFELHDDGDGMSDDTLQRLFEPLTQGDSGLTRQDGGIGLGVAVARRLIEAMDGTVSCETELGVGTSFRFSVRLRETAHQGPPTAPLRGPVAIVAADEEDREQLATLVRALGGEPSYQTPTSDMLDGFADAHASGLVLTDDPKEKTRIGFRWRRLKVCLVPFLRTARELERLVRAEAPEAQDPLRVRQTRDPKPRVTTAAGTK
jgi:hypothetical protein